VARARSVLVGPGAFPWMRGWSFLASESRELLGERRRPATVPQRVHFHPDSVLPFVQLEGAAATLDPKVPMMAPGAPGQLALAPNEKTASSAFLERLASGEAEV
jgi:hypothetical protein